WPGTPTAGASCRPAGTPRPASGTSRPASRSSCSTATPARSRPWPSAPTASWSPAPTRPTPSTSGTPSATAPCRCCAATPARCAASRADEGADARTPARDTLGLWEAATGRFRCALEGQPAPITALAFAPDSATLASGSYQNSDVWLWDVAKAEPALLVPDAAG